MIKNIYLKIGGGMLLLLLTITFLAPFLPYIQDGMEVGRVILEPGRILTAPFPPTVDLPLGSDMDGRNLISVLVIGAKDTLFIIILIAAIRYVVGIVLGIIASFGNRLISSMLDTFDQMFSSLPVIFFAVLLLNIPFIIFLDSRFIVAIVTIAIIEAGRVGVTVKEQILSIKREPYIEAAVTVGVSPYLMTKNYYIPNILPSLIVNFCYDIGRIALVIGQLGVFSVFITQELVQLEANYGEIQNTSFNWATLLGEAKNLIYTAYWIPLFAALALLYVIISFNILGEGLRRFFEKRHA
ncbi:ABC transporter permease subunit [Sutcliffiella horikoshii]|uniref:ABC transporter permease subunit n=1 Tax=Sutcliffiella horikoshii TaxID=79883 RepID=A0A5D4SWB8_9BACI|nr:ABC transporter permease subunit [Sutcliffiella horikoshii]TYS67670.1 ABC transporter permease subunit [Sutcliffiella horikoshii]